MAVHVPSLNKPLCSWQRVFGIDNASITAETSPVCDSVGRRVAHAEPVPDRDPEPVVTEGGEADNVAGDAADLLIDFVPVAVGVLGHLDDVVWGQVGSKWNS